MSTLIYIIGGMAALILLTGVARMNIRRNRSTGLQFGDRTPTAHHGIRVAVSFRTGLRWNRSKLDEAAQDQRPPLPLEPKPELDDFSGVRATPTIDVAPVAGTGPESSRMPSSSVGPERPIAWLKAVRGSALDVLLTQKEIVVGRDNGCNLVLNEETVSRKHCTFMFRSGKWYVRPFLTPNGTYVNDKLAAPELMTPLKSHDLIRIGSSVVLKITMPKVERPAMKLATGAATSAGGRDRNEDSFLATAAMAAVADGVAGRSAGDLASGIVIDMLRGKPTSLSLDQFMPAVSAAIRARAASDPDTANMATTLDAMQLVPQGVGYRIFGVHIGDGYVLVDDGVRIRQLTSPHTLDVELIRQGSPSALHNSERSRLARAIGFAETSEIDSWSEPALIGMRFILTTDGIINALGVKRLLRSLERLRNDPPQRVADAVISFAEQDFADSAVPLDNLTMVVADVVEHQEDDSKQSARSSPLQDD